MELFARIRGDFRLLTVFCEKLHLDTPRHTPLYNNFFTQELKLPFVKVASTEVVSGISGETEQTIRSLFNEAVVAAPSILFIDEIDSITPKRENAGREMERRIVTQILTCMDGKTELF